MDEIERVGVIRGEDGQLYIPASKRPDGSWRRPRKVKEGYIPQDEIPKYLSKGAEWLQSREGFIPGLTVEQEPQEKPVSTDGLSKSAKKNMKRKQKKKQERENINQAEAAQMTETFIKMEIQSDKPENAAATDEGPSEALKKLRNLKKKIRQIEDIEKKISSGELKNPEKEQLEKISKKQSILDQIKELELEDS